MMQFVSKVNVSKSRNYLGGGQVYRKVENNPYIK